MVRGLRHIRTMRQVWDERRKAPARRSDQPSIVRRFAVTPPARRRVPPKGATSVRAWVFSRRPTGPRPERQLLVKRTKEPEVDLFDEEDELVVLAELPGVHEQDIRINVENDLLIIEAISTGPLGELHYYKEVMLPYEARKDIEHSSKSGVLEVHLRPKKRVGRRARTKDKRTSAVSARQRGKKKKPRRQKNESSENEGKRKPRSRRKKGPKRKS